MRCGVDLDGRKPTPKIPDDLIDAGCSTGHWEGDTVVVETVACTRTPSSRAFLPIARR